MPNDRNLKRFVDLTRRKRELERELKELQTEIDALDAAICDDFAEGGVQSVRIDGMTVYVGSRLAVGVADGVDKQDLIERLKAEGLERCVTLQHNTLAAAIREATDEETGELRLSPELQGMLKIREIYKVSARST